LVWDKGKTRTRQQELVLITSRGERVKSISSNKNHSLGHKGTRKRDRGETVRFYVYKREETVFESSI